jgi:uncharacterized protein with PQ loop repeat
MEQQLFLDIKRQRTRLIICLLVAIAAVNVVVFLSAGSDIGTEVGDLSTIATIFVAFALSLVVVRRQKTSGLFGRAYTILAIGLTCWLIAEALWAYYQIGLGIENPFPSLADAFWLIGYVPFAYHLFSTGRFFGKGLRKSILTIVTLAVALYVIFYASVILNTFDLTGPEALLSLAIGISYPLADGIILLPALAVLLNSGRGYLTSIPWMFVAFILLVAADSFLGLGAVTETTGQTYHITMLYNAAYLCIAAGLFWYNRMFIGKLPIEK